MYYEIWPKCLYLPIFSCSTPCVQYSACIEDSVNISDLKYFKLHDAFQEF